MRLLLKRIVPQQGPQHLDGALRLAAGPILAAQLQQQGQPQTPQLLPGPACPLLEHVLGQQVARVHLQRLFVQRRVSLLAGGSRAGAELVDIDPHHIGQLHQLLARRDHRRRDPPRASSARR